MNAWYFHRFEHRRPPEAQPLCPARDFLYRVLSTASIALGAWYLYWRWTESLNWEAPGFSISLALAETLAFFGTLLFTFNLWRLGDTPRRSPPTRLSHIAPHVPQRRDRALSVDIFLPTYNEDEELVRLSIRDAKQVHVPAGVLCQIYVLDDGCRERMRRIAEEEGVHYIPRKESEGFKAGNIRHGMRHSSGDLMVILDADTRPMPNFLLHTLGYFRDPDVAWVQTPQWFFDLPGGVALPRYLRRRLGRFGGWVGRCIVRVLGPIHVGRDILGNDPRLFYDVILRRRNAVNASFCCGAGSIHRREAIMQGALKCWWSESAQQAKDLARNIPDPYLRQVFRTTTEREIARRQPLTPYRFHVSEDIYTGMLLHADPDRRWKSVYHPEVLSKMLSPQDLLSWTIQRFKYAGGTLDIAVHDPPWRHRGMDWRQKLMYLATIYSYFSPLWVLLFLLAPMIFFFTGIAPVAAYDAAFYMHILPFLILNRLALMVATWGVPSLRGEQYYLAFFWQNIQAMWEVICRQPIAFRVTPKALQRGNFLPLVWPQLLVIVFSLLGMLSMGWDIYTGAEKQIPAYIVNVFWSLNNCLALSVIVRAAFFRGAE